MPCRLIGLLSSFSHTRDGKRNPRRLIPAQKGGRESKISSPIGYQQRGWFISNPLSSMVERGGCQVRLCHLPGTIGYPLPCARLTVSNSFPDNWPALQNRLGYLTNSWCVTTGRRTGPWH